MRRISVRLLALCLAVLMLGAALVSCGKTLSGVYENNTLGLVITYTFSGKEFTRTMKGLTTHDTGMTTTGTYRISGDTIYLTSSAGLEEELTFSGSGKTIYIADMEFSKK